MAALDHPTERSGSDRREQRDRAMDVLRFSFVIANFNYARFVARAIDSALAQNWSNLEVIVVDDGSTDDSRAIIEGHGNKVVAIFQENSGQRVANNVGFERSTGDVIVFLDADDVLAPDFAAEVAHVWRPGLSKVQVQMARVDADERELGSIIPRIASPPSPSDIRKWVSSTREYPTPPGSGNAYSREFLARFFPIGPEHDAFTDSTCLALAPILGDIVTVAKPLVLYRQHGENDSDLLAADGRFAREVDRALRRQNSAEEICRELGTPVPQGAKARLGIHLLQLRIASHRLSPASHPIADDTRLSLARDIGQSLFARSFVPFWRRVVIAAWSLLTLVLPIGLATKLIRMRFSAG